ncbi:uncharacterized protein EI90DRAFT_3055888 [Cantharellus anzutake]|uniref:uncharacterized protein n=1 Tax=Cantharellus anzutake TaxID=1750568 RepID=UPI001903E255|nr:uncharacterized protein EI90DRAFT_3055888 [Cantharellus anzutake]KAF8331922.1 hypothetical protein EI90DRAFT_3055888 [Cantharellus anzutake]
MSNPQQVLGDPSAPQSTLTEGMTIQVGCAALARMFHSEDDNDHITRMLPVVWSIVNGALGSSKGQDIDKRLRDNSEFGAYIMSDERKGERELVDLLRSMANNEVPWRDLFKNEAFLMSELETNLVKNKALATTLAWNSIFEGDLANVLFMTIADYLDKDKDSYIRVTNIINSAGTGKSRVVDQLGTEIIVVPMCLRQGSEGFPPPDRILRDWFVSVKRDRASVQKKLSGFAYSLFVVTLQKLVTIESENKDIRKLPPLTASATKSRKIPKEYVPLVVDRHKRLASAFRKYMTTGQTYFTSNPDRETFYKEVIELVEKFAKDNKQVSNKNGAEHRRHISEGKDPREAGERLCRFIDEYKALESAKGPQRPLVVLAFDEAHVFTDNLPNQKGWNLFSELRRILQQIRGLPIFSLFLSTAGRSNKFSPEIRSDLSARARRLDYRPLDPICEISFDDIAYPTLKGTVTIDRVVETDWISHLGRPLFGSYWDELPMQYKNEQMIMDYAKQKLLCGPTQLTDDPAGTLACLSQRFALEFNMGVSARDVSYVQVERHMRLCIAATAGLENMITIPGSEPLLAEAAYQLMKDTKKNAVRHLANHSDLNCIDRGRRGELVAALLIMQTYDAARAISGRRWVSVANFMEALLPTSNYEMLLLSGPTSWPIGEGTLKRDTFKAIFKDYGMWFNHVIKIERKEMFSIDHLWKFVTRGAMILCATNQGGIDIILPVCHTTKNLGPHSVTAVVIQVKNAQDHKATLNPSLFNAMDSVVKTAIFSMLNVDPVPDSESTMEKPKTAERGEPKKKKRKVSSKRPKKVILVPEKVHSKPVIRVVFALASPEPAIIFRERPEVMHHVDGFTTFDIWLAGLSPKTFKQIEEADLQSYKRLLERSLMPHDGFKLKDEPTVGKKARGACRRRMAPLTLPGRSHHGIHLPGAGSELMFC